MVTAQHRAEWKWCGHECSLPSSPWHGWLRKSVWSLLLQTRLCKNRVAGLQMIMYGDSWVSVFCPASKFSALQLAHWPTECMAMSEWVLHIFNQAYWRHGWHTVLNPLSYIHDPAYCKNDTTRSVCSLPQAGIVWCMRKYWLPSRLLHSQLTCRNAWSPYFGLPQGVIEWPILGLQPTAWVAI